MAEGRGNKDVFLKRTEPLFIEGEESKIFFISITDFHLLLHL